MARQDAPVEASKSRRVYTNSSNCIKHVFSKRNTKIRNKDNQKGQELLEKFGIKDSELENIFDLIEEEFPDL